VQLRAAAPNMADISAFGDIWGIEAKTAIFNAWDPESPRTYDNFNPFERNDEGTMCDTNGCFPGQSRGYKPPNRPDQSWAIMQVQAPPARMTADAVCACLFTLPHGRIGRRWAGGAEGNGGNQGASEILPHRQTWKLEAYVAGQPRGATLSARNCGHDAARKN